MPNPIIPQPLDICKGALVTLSIYGGDSTMIEESENQKYQKVPYTTSLKPTDEPKFHVWVKNVYNNVQCAKRVEVDYHVDSLPAIQIEGITEICNGEDIQLTASDVMNYGANKPNSSDYTYRWTDPKGTKTATMTASPTTSTTYGITISNGKCSATENVDVTVFPTPRVIAEAFNGKVCPGGSDTLTAYYLVDDETKGVLKNCEWYTDKDRTHAATFSRPAKENGNNDTIIVSNITTPTTYYAYGQDKNGCWKLAQVTVYVKPLPTISIAGDTIICNTMNIALTAAGAETYTWYENGTTEVMKGSKLTLQAMMGAGDGEELIKKYSVVGVKEGCEGTSVKNVHIFREPTITIKGRNEVCFGDTAKLTASGSAAGKEYMWTGLGSTEASVIVAPIGNEQIFQVTGYNEKGCPGTAEHTIKINENPTLSITGLDPICYGEKASLINVLDLNGSTLKEVVWTMFDKKKSTAGTVVANPREIVLQDTTIFQVTAKNAAGCEATAEATIIVYPKPTITVTAPSICDGEEVVATVDGAATYA